MNYLIFKKLQIPIKRWWFRYAIRQLIEKSIILLLLFSLIMQLITESINYCTPLTPNPSLYAAWRVSISCTHSPQKYTAPSQFRHHVLHGGIAGGTPSAPQKCHVLEDLFIYLSWGGRGGCTWNVPVLVSSPVGSNQMVFWEPK